MTKLLQIAAIAVLVAVVVPNDSSAQFRVGPHVGLNTDGTEIFLGLNSQFAVPFGEREIWGNAGFDLYPFIDGAFVTRLNLDAVLPVASGRFYGGGGLLVEMVNYDADVLDDDTNFGINIKGGVLLDDLSKGFRPFIEVNQVIGPDDVSDFSVRAGVLWGLGS